MRKSEQRRQKKQFDLHLILSGLSSSTLPSLPLRHSEISDGVLGKMSSEKKMRNLQ
jgi:hypothetical protein